MVGGKGRGRRNHSEQCLWYCLGAVHDPTDGVLRPNDGVLGRIDGGIRPGNSVLHPSAVLRPTSRFLCPERGVIRPSHSVRWPRRGLLLPLLEPPFPVWVVAPPAQRTCGLVEGGQGQERRQRRT